MSSRSVTICLWSGPRNISTALMYSFAQRSDTVVVDEPLYAHYLSKSASRSYHPGADEVLASQDQNGERVVETVILGEHSRPVRFFKNMTHHLLDLDRSFLAKTCNVLLIRDPQEMLPSYANTVENPTLEDTGYADQWRLFEELQKRGQDPPVLDARLLLLDPRGVLMELCRRIGIEFQESMLRWKAGPRPEDGVWAPYWYRSVHRSTGFQPYRAKSAPFPQNLAQLLEECRPFYEKLLKYAIATAE